MSSDYQQFEKRKQDHLDLALMPANQTYELNGLDPLHLVHEALPDLDFDELNLMGNRFGKPVEKPLIISYSYAHSFFFSLYYFFYFSVSSPWPQPAFFN